MFTLLGEKGAASFYNMHVFPCDPKACAHMFQKVSAHTRPSMFNMISGDFNFVANSQDRMYYDIDNPIHDSDELVHNIWLKYFGHFTDVSQLTSYTQFGPEHCARLDRVYCEASKLPSSMFKVRSSVLPNFRNLSDHVPIRTHIHVKRNRSTSKTNRIPEHIINNPEVATRTQDMYQKTDKSHMTCWDKLQLLKSCFHDAHKHVKHNCKPVADCIEQDLSTASSFFRAVLKHDSKNIHICVNKCPRLATCYHTKDKISSLTPAFFAFWQELTAKGADCLNEAGGLADGVAGRVGAVAKTVASFQAASSKALDCLWDEQQNKPVYTREEKVKLLEGHWGEGF